MKKKIIAAITGIALVLAGIFTGCSAEKTPSIATKKVSAEGKLTITCFQAGKADAFALTTADRTVIIDTGLKENSEDIEDYLDENNIKTIDALILTHFDKDHVGGAADLVNDYKVSNVYTTYQTKSSEYIDAFMDALSNKGLDAGMVRENTEFTIGDVTYAIYPPEETTYNKDESNNSSLVIRVSYNDFSMLFTGDAESERISELLRTQGLESTILKVPYHGHWQDELAYLVPEIAPKYAIITSSDEEKEDDLTTALLSQDNVKYYLTREGTVTITTDGTNINITQ